MSNCNDNVLRGSERMLTLRVKRGATYNIRLQLLSSDLDADGNPIVVSLDPYFNARMQIRDKENNSLLVDLNEDNGNIILDKTTNIISITIPPEDTSFSKFGQTQGVYDLFLDFVDADGNTQTLSPIFGLVLFFEEVTR